MRSTRWTCNANKLDKAKNNYIAEKMIKNRLGRFRKRENDLTTFFVF